MNHHRSQSSSNKVAWLVIGGFAVLAPAFLIGTLALISASQNSSLGFILFGLAAFITLASAIWLFVKAGQEMDILARELVKEQHAAFVAYQQYAAYTAHQQAEAANRQAEAEQQQREANLKRMSALQGLLSLTPTEFEQAVAELFKFWGYSAVERTSSADSSADIVCFDKTGQKTVIQCKRYSPGNLVSSTEVDLFIRMMTGFHHAHQGVFVTTSDFTEPALALGDEHDIWMIDGKELADHMQEFRAARER